MSRLLQGRKQSHHQPIRKQNAVNQHFLSEIVFLVALVLVFASCVPSEETGAGNRAKSPVQIFGPIDTTHRIVRRAMSQDTTSRSKNDSVKIAQEKKPRVAQNSNQGKILSVRPLLQDRNHPHILL